MKHVDDSDLRGRRSSPSCEEEIAPRKGFVAKRKSRRRRIRRSTRRFRPARKGRFLGRDFAVETEKTKKTTQKTKNNSSTKNTQTCLTIRTCETEPFHRNRFAARNDDEDDIEEYEDLDDSDLQGRGVSWE